MLREKGQRLENQKIKNVYATRASWHFHPLHHKGPYRRKLSAITGCDDISAFFGKEKWKAEPLPQHNEGCVLAMMSIGEEWWASEESFQLKIRKHSSSVATILKKCQSVDVLNMRSTTVDWQESQTRDSAPMRVIFTRSQKQLSSRNMKSHFAAPLIGNLTLWCSSDVAPCVRLVPKPAPEEKYSPVRTRKYKQ